MSESSWQLDPRRQPRGEEDRGERSRWKTWPESIPTSQEREGMKKSSCWAGQWAEKFENAELYFLGRAKGYSVSEDQWGAGIVWRAKCLLKGVCNELYMFLGNKNHPMIKATIGITHPSILSRPTFSVSCMLLGFNRTCKFWSTIIHWCNTWTQSTNRGVFRKRPISWKSMVFWWWRDLDMLEWPRMRIHRIETTSIRTTPDNEQNRRLRSSFNPLDILVQTKFVAVTDFATLHVWPALWARHQTPYHTHPAMSVKNPVLFWHCMHVHVLTLNFHENMHVHWTQPLFSDFGSCMHPASMYVCTYSSSRILHRKLHTLFMSSISFWHTELVFLFK